MCGRFIIQGNLRKLANRLGVRSEQLEAVLKESYNVAPTQSVPAVRQVDGSREAVSLRWGLVPFFAKGEAPKYSTINATIEKLESGPCWRGPWKRGQRCIMLASGFYEWQVQADGKSKQPYFISVGDQVDGFGFAALWDRSVKDDGTAIDSCSIITMPANSVMAQIHNARARMPAILNVDDWETWLTGDQTAAKAALHQYSDDLLLHWPVSTRVSMVKNNDARLIEQIEIAN